MEFKVIDEYRIENFPYDIYIKDLNLIVEYYGDRWHYPPEQYSPDYWDKVKKRYVWEKWKKDTEKIKFAKDKGFVVEIIWEHQWKKLNNRRRFIEKLIKKYKR